MLIWTVSNCQCYLSHQLKVSLLLLLTSCTFFSLLSFLLYGPFLHSSHGTNLLYKLGFGVWNIPFNFKHKRTELGQWWKDKKRVALHESRGTPIITETQWLGSVLLCWNQDTGEFEAAPESVELKNVIITAIQGWRNRIWMPGSESHCFSSPTELDKCSRKFHDLARLQKIAKNSLKMATTSFPPCKQRIHRSHEMKQYPS